MAGFLDKAKQVAQQALDEAKKGVETGQAKLDEAQAKREASKLLAALGAAFYAEQRSGGSRADVDTALQGGRPVRHRERHRWLPRRRGGGSLSPGAAPAPTPPPAPSPPPAAPSAPPADPPAAGGSAYDVPPPGA